MTPRDERTGQTRSHSSATKENIEVVKSWEQSLLERRSLVERVGDSVTVVAASGAVLLLHVVMFGGWILANIGRIPGIEPFDPFPFPMLTLTVSLEAIFLALLVLASQNRLTRQADRRSHLDLQINLLAEREMTVALQLLRDIAERLEVAQRLTPDQVELVNKTDVGKLAEEVDS